MRLEEYDLGQLTGPLLEWYASHARVLPWRSEPTPYHVWVSEIMLQQTRVEAVKPYYARFLEALPAIRDLAECPEERLLKLWEGLGYYNRVRNMQKAAQQVCAECGGELPADFEKLLELPGIGRYTAGAIASIAYGIPRPAVDGNVLRVLMRAAGDDSDIAKESVKKRTEEALQALMEDLCAHTLPDGGGAEPARGCAYGFHPGTLNQALMELGATVCLPNGAPLCEQCPWQQFCVTAKEGLADRIPVKSRAKARRVEERTVLLIMDGDRVILHRRPSRGLLAGLYEFPNRSGWLSEDEALAEVKQMRLEPLYIRPLTAAKHIFSHVEWHMQGYLIRVDSLATERSGELFAEIEEARERYAIPSAFAAYCEYLNLKLGV